MTKKLPKELKNELRKRIKIIYNIITTQLLLKKRTIQLRSYFCQQDCIEFSIDATLIFSQKNVQIYSVMNIFIWIVNKLRMSINVSSLNKKVKVGVKIYTKIRDITKAFDYTILQINDIIVTIGLEYIKYLSKQRKI